MARPEDASSFDVIIVGGGHAGAEAAWAAANLGARVGLVTLDLSRIGVMSCNPAIGGLAKGQMVREIDAMGGLMARAADASGLMFKMLNTSRGPAVRGPRAQCDKDIYAEIVRTLLESRSEISIIAAAVERFMLDERAPNPRIAGVLVRSGDEIRAIHAPAVVLTTGTFMRGLMHTGDARTPGGRVGEKPASVISEALRDLGFELGRLKTGTPPRLKRSTIDWECLEQQCADADPIPFSDLTPREPRFEPPLPQHECRLTRTTPEAHAAIRDNLHRAPMYNGQIDTAGPRYCPSIEDKVVRFAERESHHVFLEPETIRADTIYCNGISTSLPADVQQTIVRTMPGCATAEILRLGYAVEYDMVLPHQIHATTESRPVEGLFLAGQINGTSGYEEAGGQGLIAGLNAARRAAGRSAVALRRDQAYIGVLLDDLVTRTPVEPYRMFTSRAEHRLLLRADNAADRLTPLARELGLIDDERWRLHQRRREQLDRLNAIVDRAKQGDVALADLLRRPEFTVHDLASAVDEPFDRAVLETLHADRAYAGYIARQRAEIKRSADMERRRVPESLDFTTIPGLRAEARQALLRFRPDTFAQAARLEGVTPADISILLVHTRRRAEMERVAAG